jgi:hypothetical protein
MRSLAPVAYSFQAAAFVAASIICSKSLFEQSARTAPSGVAHWTDFLDNFTVGERTKRLLQMAHRALTKCHMSKPTDLRIRA